MMMRSFSICPPDMIQTNKHYGTKRLVKRRPRFVSAEDVKEKRVRYDILNMLHWACVFFFFVVLVSDDLTIKKKTLTLVCFLSTEDLWDKCPLLLYQATGTRHRFPQRDTRYSEWVSCCFSILIMTCPLLFPLQVIF